MRVIRFGGTRLGSGAGGVGVDLGVNLGAGVGMIRFDLTFDVSYGLELKLVCGVSDAKVRHEGYGRDTSTVPCSSPPSPSPSPSSSSSTHE